MLGSRILPLRFAVESRLEEVVYVKTIITDNSQFSNVLSYLTDEAATDKEGGIAIFDQGVCKAETFWNDPKEEVRQYVVEKNIWPNAIAEYLEKPLLDALVKLSFGDNKPVNACLYYEEDEKGEYDQDLDTDQYVYSDNDAEFDDDEEPIMDPNVSAYVLKRYCDDEKEAEKIVQSLNRKYGIQFSIVNKEQAGANSLPLIFAVDSKSEYETRKIVYLEQNFSPKLAKVVASLLSQNWETFTARPIEGNKILQRIRAKENFSTGQAEQEAADLNAKELVLTYELVELDPTQKFIATCQNVLARLAKLAEPILNAQAVQQR
jgi:hypothetical protein